MGDETHDRPACRPQRSIGEPVRQEQIDEFLMAFGASTFRSDSVRKSIDRAWQRMKLEVALCPGDCFFCDGDENEPSAPRWVWLQGEAEARGFLISFTVDTSGARRMAYSRPERRLIQISIAGGVLSPKVGNLCSKPGTEPMDVTSYDS
jgi:hypothetical protein